MSTSLSWLDNIREREKKARLGPWRVYNSLGIVADYVVDPELGPLRNLVLIDYDGPDSYYNPESYLNQDEVEFVAHARTDIPALLSLVDHLESVIKELKSVKK